MNVTFKCINGLKIGNNTSVCKQDRATVETDLSGYADRNTDSTKTAARTLLIRLTRHLHQLGSGFFVVLIV